MKILLFGATGMVGQGVLRECLLDLDVEVVQTFGRTATGIKDPKLREIVRPDLFRYSEIEDQLGGFDACLFCLGVSAFRVSESEYYRLTYTLTTAAAETLSRLNPGMTFIYVSGAGTDSSENGRVMWARVKGKTENELLQLPFKAAYMLRPAGIVPVHGERSKTAVYRIGYRIAAPLLPLIRRWFPDYVLTTEEVGRAMLNVARFGSAKQILEPGDIRRASQ